MIYIYHHLGLGDHIICNGLVREYAKQFNQVTIFCKQHNYDSVSFMYRDLFNLKILIGDDNYVNNYLKNIPEYLIVRIGYTGKNWSTIGLTFDKNFYVQANVDFEKRWNLFYVNRDIEKESLLYNNAKLNKPYIFVHEDIERGYKINNKYLQGKNIFKVNKQMTNNIFDYLKIIEESTEIHLIESCFMFLVDSINIKNIPIYIHKYSRTYDWFNKPTLKKEWIVL